MLTLILKHFFNPEKNCYNLLKLLHNDQIYIKNPFIKLISI